MNIETEQSKEVISQSPSYTVDNLLTRLGVVAQATLWKKIDTIVQVQGKVSKIRAQSYNGYSYFDLNGVNSTITVKCPSNRLPAENENIIIEGMPVIITSKYNKGLEVQLDGEPIAQIAPVDYIDEVIEIKKDSYVRLNILLEGNALHSLKLFGSETGIRDAISQLPLYADQIKSQVITVSNKDKILEALESGLSDASSFAIVRGGDDRTLDIWDDARFVKKLVEFDLPFYVALGHTHHAGLVAQYADESFSTPSIFGSTVSDILEMQAYVDNLDSTVERLDKEHEQKLAELTKTHQSETAKINEANQSQLLKYELLGRKRPSFRTNLVDVHILHFHSLL